MKGELLVIKQYTLEELLLQFSLGDLDLHSFIDLLCMPTLVIGVTLDGCRKECVDEGGFPKP